MDNDKEIQATLSAPLAKRLFGVDKELDITLVPLPVSDNADQELVWPNSMKSYRPLLP